LSADKTNIVKSNYLKQYLSALGVVVTLMGLYHLTVVPAMEPAHRRSVEPPRYSSELADAQWWQALFPKDAWQNNKPKVLQTPRGILLFSDWQQLDADRWKLDRLTMIIPQSSRGSTAKSANVSMNDEHFPEQDVWLINADKGATIQFMDAFNWTKRKMPPVKGGRLEGQIHITRRSKIATPERPWYLTTRDLKIDRREISTVEPVEIHFDNSVIRGRDLSIMLKQDLLSRSADDTSPWGVLESMELIYIDEISLGLPPGGLWSDVKQTVPGLPTTTGLPAKLQLKSGGPFRFDFIDSQASLVNGVHAIHQLGSLAPDQFWSQEVHVKLEPESADINAAKPLTNGGSKASVSVGGLHLKHLSARGMDPVGPISGQTLVALDAPNVGAAVRAKRLDVNFVDGQIELFGKLEGAQAVNTVASLNYLGYEFRAPQIQYRSDPKSEHLGWLAASGPGELLVPASADMGQANVRWKQSFQMKPGDGEQWISLSGQTLVESSKYGFMTSEAMDLWLKPNPHQASSPANQPKDKNPSNIARTPDYLPDRLKAVGNVVLNSSQMKAMVNELNLWLVHPVVASTVANDEKLRLADSLGNPMYQFTSPPTNEKPQGLNALANTIPVVPGASTDLNAPVRPQTEAEPITIEGEKLQSRIVTTGSQSWIDYLTVDGPLRLYRKLTPNDPATWLVSANTLQLSTNAHGLADVQILGTPVSVEMGEANIKTSEIRYNQESGLLWMDQPGQFTISAEAMNTNRDSRSKIGGNNLRWLDAPTCKWNGRLQFNGSVVRIQGDIDLNGTVSAEANRMWIVNGGCHLMDLHLRNPIDLRLPKQTTSSLERIVMGDQIDLRAAQTDMQLNRISLQRIVAPELTYHLAQNQIVVAGPGDVRTWNLVDSNGALLVVRDKEGNASPRIQGAHLNFRNNMVTYIDRSEVICDGKVELAAGFLNSWDEMIDLNTMQRLKNDEILIGCDRLQAYDTSRLQPPAGSFASNPTIGGGSLQNSNFWEIQALGNVTFSGKSVAGEYSGNGYRAVYTQAKDMLLLEGDGRSPANVKIVPPDTSREPILHTSVISAKINVKTMATSDMRITGGKAEFPNRKSPATANSQPQPLDNNRPSTTNPRDVNKWFRQQ
jgi:hypothetical protein